jgi:hypothetical protein
MDPATLHAILVFSVLAIAIVQVASFILRVAPWGGPATPPTYGGNPVVTGVQTRP